MTSTKKSTMTSANKQSRFKKSLITAGAVTALVIGTSSMIHAKHHSGANGDMQRSGKMQERLYEKLDLTEVQKTQIENIREVYKPQLQSLRQAHKAQRAQKETLDPASSDYVSKKQAQHAEKFQAMQQGVTLRAQMQHEIALVLTPEQRAEAQALKAEHKAKRMERRKDRKEKRQQKRDELEQ